MAERITTPGGPVFLGERIARARRKLGETQAGLAERAEVDRTVISKLEAGRFETLGISVQKVCTALGIDPRNPDADARLDYVLRRLVALAVKAPQLVGALDGMLDALEGVGDRGGSPHDGSSDPPATPA